LSADPARQPTRLARDPAHGSRRRRIHPAFRWAGRSS
jgi:hypothetical protein